MAGIYGQNDTVNLPGGATVGPVGPASAAPVMRSPWTVQQRNRMGWNTPANSGYSAPQAPVASTVPEGTLPFYGGKPQNMPGMTPQTGPGFYGNQSLR